MWNRKTLEFSQIVLAISLVILFIYLGLALYEYGRVAVAALTFPFPLDYGEGPVLEQIIRLSHLENIYRNALSEPPYTVANYPPFFQLIQTPFALVFGPSYFYGRLVSILSALASAALIGLILYTLTADRIASTIGGVMLLAFPYILQWSVLDRVDTLALVSALAGLYVIVRWGESRRGLVVAALFFIAAIFTLPTYAFAAPVTALVWLLQRRKFSFGIGLIVIVIGISLALFGALNEVTQGGFYLNTITANLNSFSVQTVVRNVSEIYVHVGFLVIGCLIFIGMEPLGQRTRSWALVTPYFICSALIALTIGKTGSSVNYLYELVAAFSLVSGALIAWVGTSNWLRALVVLSLILQINLLIEWSREEYIPLITAKVTAYREVVQLAMIARDSPGLVLADEYMGLLPLYGRRIYFQPFEYKQLQEAAVWNQKPLIASIEQQKFSAILLYEPRRWNAIPERWTPEVLDVIYAHYTLSKTLAETFVYVPK